MGYKALCFGLSCILLAYSIYTPLPENIEEPWKVQIVDAGIKVISLMGTFLENIGIMKYEELFSKLMAVFFTKPTSDENVTVIDTAFDNIPVRLYLPKRKSGNLRPAVIYVHGGVFTLASCKFWPYDFINRWTANQLDAVVVAIEYRLAPQYKFPVCIEDSVFAVNFFLQDKILAEYRVDPSRICISGDSSGSTIAILVVKKLLNTFTPSHVEYQHGPLLIRHILIKLMSLSVTEDEKLYQAMVQNEYLPQGSEHLLKFVNWTNFLPEKYKKNHVYTEPTVGKINSSYAVIIPHMSPLAVSDSQLRNLPLTYILTCQHDIVRDDGLMYVTRLRNAGIQVTHDHVEDGFHGAYALYSASQTEKSPVSSIPEEASGDQDKCGQVLSTFQFAAGTHPTFVLDVPGT
ncbi:arylacetamide deacetylase-like 2 [Ctenodactylus gundi]